MRWTAEPSARRSAPRNFCTLIANGSFKVRRWPEGDRTAGAMASIAPGAASPYPTGIPHPSEPPTSSQPERWRLPWRRRQCQPSTGIVHEKGNKGRHRNIKGSRDLRTRAPFRPYLAKCTKCGDGVYTNCVQCRGCTDALATAVLACVLHAAVLTTFILLGHLCDLQARRYS